MRKTLVRGKAIIWFHVMLHTTLSVMAHVMLHAICSVMSFPPTILDHCRMHYYMLASCHTIKCRLPSLHQARGYVTVISIQFTADIHDVVFARVAHAVATPALAQVSG